MDDRAALESIAHDWISLWCVPVDWALFDRLHAKEFEDRSAAGRGKTKADFASGLAALARAFPDLRTRIEHLVVDTKTMQVAVRWSAVGTNCELFLGAGPTYRTTPFTGIEIIEVAGGRIVRRWGEWDVSAHARRAGAPDEPDEPAEPRGTDI